MRQESPYRLSLLLAILFHALLFFALFMRFFSSDLHQIQLQPDVDIIKAVAVSASAASAVPHQKPLVEKPIEPAKLQEVEQETPEALQKRQESIEQAQAHTLQVQKQQEAEQAKKIAQQQAQAKQKALEKQKAEQALLQEQRAEKEAEIKKAAQEKAKQEQIKEQQVAQQKLAEKKAHQKAQARLKVAQQQALQDQIAKEQNELTAAKTNDQLSEINKYKALIEQAISQSWVVPGGSNPNLACELIIQLGPGGKVLSVQVSRSSGDPALDNSARAAVFKASPLPAPSDPDLFDKFRRLRLKVKPENIH